MVTLPYHSTLSTTLPHPSQRHATKLSSFIFTIDDAVWLVQQRRRLQANNSGPDASLSWVSRAAASIIYDVKGVDQAVKWSCEVESLMLMASLLSCSRLAAMLRAVGWLRSAAEGGRDAEESEEMARATMRCAAALTVGS
jgi:hypothetical protein